jgi:tetraacyldisaccharide 4'-kinase
LKFGNGFLLPAGPLRERVLTAISKSDVVFNVEGERFCEDKTEFILSREFELKDRWNGGYLAFCGLAVNQKFFSSLEALELDVKVKLEFRDHHSYLRSELEDILKKADDLELKAITTEKDFAKIPDDLKPRFSVLKMALLLKDKPLLINIIKKHRKLNNLT